MSFTGFSSDEEGSIIYDGEKFIVTNPSKVPDNFNAHGKPVIGLPPDHPSHAQNQQTSTEQSTGQASSAKSDKQGSTGATPREIRPPAPAHRQPILVPPDLLDISEDAVGSVGQHIAALYDVQSIAGSARPIEQAPTPVTDAFGYTPLTPGQEMDIDYLLSFVTATLARDVLITMKRDGIPPRSQRNEFMSPHAEWGWDTTSDALALEMIDIVEESDMDEWLGHADSALVEGVAQDLGDNAIEGVIVIDAKTGETLFDRTGVVREDGSQYVGMQDHEAKALLAEALSGRELIFLHNHTEEVGASDEDLDSAFRAGAALLIVITPQGQEFVYIRGKYGMVKVRDEKASYKVGLENPEETEELRAKSEEQEAAFLVDSPELIFLQEDPEVIANMDVNPDDISRYGDLKGFVNTRLDELQGIGEKELLAKIGESMTLLEDIFGYSVEFCGGKSCDEEFNIEALTIEERRLAMKQVHNLATILFHFLNDLGIEIMQSTPEKTRYILWADDRILDLHNEDDYANRGHVFLPASLGDEDESELEKVYLGSEIKRGAIAHEVSHELGRRFDMDFSKYAPDTGAGQFRVVHENTCTWWPQL